MHTIMISQTHTATHTARTYNQAHTQSACTYVIIISHTHTHTTHTQQHTGPAHIISLHTQPGAHTISLHAHTIRRTHNYHAHTIRHTHNQPAHIQSVCTHNQHAHIHLHNHVISHAMRRTHVHTISLARARRLHASTCTIMQSATQSAARTYTQLREANIPHTIAAMLSAAALSVMLSAAML